MSLTQTYIRNEATPKIILNTPPSQMARINELETARRNLLDQYNEHDGFNTARRIRIHDIDEELAGAWELERRYRAATRAARN